MRLLLFLLLFVPIFADEPAALPDGLLTEFSASGLKLEAHDELKRDDFQTLFSAGVLENMFERIKKVESATESVFLKEDGERVTLIRLTMGEALSKEDYRELASIESLSLERSLEQLKMAQFFVNADEPKEAIESGNGYTDQFVYSLRQAGNETPILIKRARHYGPRHFAIMTSAQGGTKVETLAKWLLKLPETSKNMTEANEATE